MEANVLAMFELSLVMPRKRKITVDLSKSERLMNFFGLNTTDMKFLNSDKQKVNHIFTLFEQQAIKELTPTPLSPHKINGFASVSFDFKYFSIFSLFIDIHEAFEEFK